MLYEITHQTSCEYDNEVSLSHHVVRLRPRELHRQRCPQHELMIEPKTAATHSRIDYFGNTMVFLAIESAHRRFAVTARSRVEVSAGVIHNPIETPPWETVREFCRGDRLTLALEAVEFAFNSTLIKRRPEFAEYALPAFPAGRPALDGVLDLTRTIHRDFKFDPAATTTATPLEEVFLARRGVCQDFAQFAIACLRSLGLPARYVSGYLETTPPPGKARLVGADASHAWFSFFCPGNGWIDVDPTNNLLPAERHITVAWGRDYADVSPVRGVLVGSGEHVLKVAVDVAPLV